LYDVVQLLIDLPDKDLAAGTVGTVVHVVDRPNRSYELEFVDNDGKRLALPPLPTTRFAHADRRWAQLPSRFLRHGGPGSDQGLGWQSTESVVNTSTRRVCERCSVCGRGHKLPAMTSAVRDVRRFLAATVACLVVLTGCSSAPSASEWATSVCAALKPWRASITQLNERATTQMATATTTAQTKENLIALVSGAREASETARAAVAAAGIPDVDGGAAVAQGFETALAGTRDAYGKAETDLAALPVTDSTAFYDGVATVLTRLTEQYQTSGIDVAHLDSVELRQAFDGIPECR